MRDDGTHLRIIDHRSLWITGKQMVGRQAVIGDASDEAAEDRHLVQHLCRFRKIIAEDFSRFGFGDTERSTNVDRRFGLGV